MLTYKDKKTAGPTGDDVIKQQLGSLLDIMIATVQDRVCTELGVLEQEPLVLGKFSVIYMVVGPTHHSCLVTSISILN